MPFVPVPNTASAELRYVVAGQRVENTLYFTKADGVTEADLNALGVALVAWWSTSLRPAVSVEAVLSSVYLTDLETADSPTSDFVGGLPLSGQSNSPALPGNVTWALKFTTGGRGRSARGRNYMIGLTESAVTGGQLDVGTATFIRDAYAQLMDNTVTAGMDWVVVSRQTAGAARSVGVVRTVLSVSYTDLYVDSQRRRLPGRGK